MNQQKAKATRKTASPKFSPKPAVTVMDKPGVLVFREPGENPGDERIELLPVGGLDPLSIPTLLRLALKAKEAQLGILERSQ